MKNALLCVASALVLAWPSLAHAQAPTAGNLEKLSDFKTTGTPMDIPQVPQTGAKADAIKKNLARIKLPRGFKIGLYAIVPDARHIAVGPQGVVTFVGTRKSKVWAVTDRDKDRVADEVKEFAPSIGFAIPNGVCFSKDGFLFIAEQNRVLVFPAAEFFYEGPDVAAFVVVKQGELIPPDGGILQPHRARVPHRAGRQALHHARTAVQRVRAGEDGPLQEDRHRRHRPHEPRRQGPRGVRHRRAQLGGHGLQSEGQGALVHRQPGRRHGRQPAARRAQPRRQGRA